VKRTAKKAIPIQILNPRRNKNRLNPNYAIEFSIA